MLQAIRDLDVAHDPLYNIVRSAVTLRPSSALLWTRHVLAVMALDVATCLPGAPVRTDAIQKSCGLCADPTEREDQTLSRWKGDVAPVWAPAKGRHVYYNQDEGIPVSAHNPNSRFILREFDIPAEDVDSCVAQCIRHYVVTFGVEPDTVFVIWREKKCVSIAAMHYQDEAS